MRDLRAHGHEQIDIEIRTEMAEQVQCDHPTEAVSDHHEWLAGRLLVRSVQIRNDALRNEARRVPVTPLAQVDEDVAEESAEQGIERRSSPAEELGRGKVAGLIHRLPHNSRDSLFELDTSQRDFLKDAPEPTHRLDVGNPGELRLQSRNELSVSGDASKPRRRWVGLGVRRGFDHECRDLGFVPWAGSLQRELREHVHR